MRFHPWEVLQHRASGATVSIPARRSLPGHAAGRWPDHGGSATELPTTKSPKKDLGRGGISNLRFPKAIQQEDESSRTAVRQPFSP